ncbi:glycine cleavage T C-terminal barrel domain-containing protein [soil metagenome]
MTTGSLYADRSSRGKLEFTGPQRAWFLHQILTQAFEDIEPGEARDTALITAHGRMVGYMEALATDDALWLHFESELIETLPEALQRYVFATQVTIEDVTDDFGLVLVVDPGWNEIAQRVAPGASAHRTLALGVPAGYLWIAKDDLAATLVALKEAGLQEAGEDELEALRVERGMARWGHEMTEKTLPPEAGLDDIAVHYDKGCYVGQEAMAKIRFRGKVNRKLRRLRSDGPLAVGSDLTLEDSKVGTVTSAAGEHALALVRYTVEPGTRVTVGETTATVIDMAG